MKIRRKKKNNQYIIFILVILIFGMTTGYAVFSDSLNIVGTANVNGRFDIEFISSKIIDAKGINVLSSSARISEDKNTLTIDIKDMEYPGSGATVSCVVKNTGTVPAKLKNVSIIGNDDKDIDILFMDSTKIGQTLGVNEMWTVKLCVRWNINSTIERNKAVNFNVRLDYEQDVEEYQPIL